MNSRAPYLFDVTRLIWRRWARRRPTGIDRVCLAYLNHFGGHSQAVIQHDRFRGILGLDASRALFALLAEETPRFRRKLVAGAARHFRDWTGKGDGRLYLNIGHTGLDSAGFNRWVEQAGVRPVYFVHDLIPITHPEYCRSGESVRHRARMRAVLATGAGVIGNSQVTLDELGTFARQEGLPNPPSIAAWLGTDFVQLPKTAACSKRPTFVTIGTIEARKNHGLLLQLWSRLVDRMGDEAPNLVIIGQRGWEAQESFDLLDRPDRFAGHVVELNGCTDRQLAQLLAQARALLFPSFVEGYGLPLIEALAAGVPAIASDLPVFREICGDTPDYLDPRDSAGWEAAILDYAASDSQSRERQLARLKRFSPPTWSEHFDAVEKWLAALP